MYELLTILRPAPIIRASYCRLEKHRVRRGVQERNARLRTQHLATFFRLFPHYVIEFKVTKAWNVISTGLRAFIRNSFVIDFLRFTYRWKRVTLLFSFFLIYIVTFTFNTFPPLPSFRHQLALSITSLFTARKTQWFSELEEILLFTIHNTCYWKVVLNTYYKEFLCWCFFLRKTCYLLLRILY